MDASLEDLRLVVIPIDGGGRAGRPLTTLTRKVAGDCRGEDFASLVLSERSEEEKESLREWLKLAFERPDLDWSSIEELNPFPEVVLGGRAFEARYRPVMRDGKVKGFVFVGLEPRPGESDGGASLRKALTRAADMARLDPGLFSAFLGEATLSLDACEQAQKDKAVRMLHTIAGNARSFGLPWIARAARGAEEAVAEGGGVSERMGELRALLGEADEIFHAVTHAGDMGELRGRSAELSVRVLLGGLDALVRLIEDARGLAREGELLSMLARAKDLADSMRKIPVRSFYARFPGMVHDLAEALGRRVRFELDGGGLELNARLLDRLGDALVHLLRNAVEHGVEPIQERRARGKVPDGVVRLAFAREGEGITISVSDDGRGVDARELAEKARASGVEPPEDALELLFLPGFSRKLKSPAGVGLDAVKETITDLGGEASIETQPGRGTTVRLTLPERGT